MRSAALEAYVKGAEPRAGPLVLDLDQAIHAAQPDLEVAIKYGLLMYALRGDWGTWVCAIGAGTSGVALRFLYGVLLDDPKHVLRAGSSVLMTWDFALIDAVDAEAVGAYVTEAVARYDEYKANTPKILEASRAAAKARNRKPDAGR
jgi:hypothetical protein